MRILRLVMLLSVVAEPEDPDVFCGRLRHRVQEYKRTGAADVGLFQQALIMQWGFLLLCLQRPSNMYDTPQFEHLKKLDIFRNSWFEHFENSKTFKITIRNFQSIIQNLPGAARCKSLPIDCRRLYFVFLISSNH